MQTTTGSADQSWVLRARERFYLRPAKRLTARAPLDVGVTQPNRPGQFQLRLKFGKQAYCVVEVRRGEEAAEVAKKLRELADQVAELKE